MQSIITKSEIENGMLQLGVKSGMMLEVHCSLGSLGHVNGGAETVIEALKQVVGKDGAIVMPSFLLSPELPLEEIDRKLNLATKIKIIQNDDEKTAMGIVSDTFRKMPDVLTGEGLFRVSAWGKDAVKHSSGFHHLIASGGYALLIGVDIYRLSAMHYVEEYLPGEIKNLFTPSKEARELYPESDWFIESWIPPVKAWYTIQDRAYKKGYITDGFIGNSKCMLLNVEKVIGLYRYALQNEPFKLYGLT